MVNVSHCGITDIILQFMLCNDFCFLTQGGTILGSPDEVLDLGDTEVTQDVFMDFLSGIEQQNFRFVTKTPGVGGLPDFK